MLLCPELNQRSDGLSNVVRVVDTIRGRGGRSESHSF